MFIGNKMIACLNCGKPSEMTLCPDCNREYIAENNRREDIKPLTEEILDEMFKKFEKAKSDMYDRLNRGI